METLPSKPEGRAYILPIILIFGIAILVCIAWFMLNPGPIGGNGQQSGQKQLSPADSRKLMELKNLALGNLEIHQFAETESALNEIARLTPDDPFATRNLAICRQLALEAIDKQRLPAEHAKATTAVQEAIEKSKKAEPKSFIPWVISSRVATKLDNIDQALNDLREAMQLDPDAIGPAYDLFTMLQAVPTDGPSPEGVAALRKVYEKTPQNLFVIKDWLPLVAQIKDPGFANTVKQAKDSISPLFETIKLHTRIDLGQKMDEAIAAAADGKWPVAQQSMRIVKNLIISEAARDKRLVMLDSLEYLLPDFNAETKARLNLPATDLPDSKPVHFQPPKSTVGWPATPDARDLALVDFDLDGRADLISLEKNKLTAWGRKGDDQPWVVIATIETGGDFNGLSAFDFDDDVDSVIKARMSNELAKKLEERDPLLDRQCHTADPDAIAFGPSGLKLFENLRDPASDARSWVTKSGGAEFDAVRDVVTVIPVDVDADGDLDLVVSTTAGLKVFSNRGNKTFEDITGRSMLPPATQTVTAMGIVDWDWDSNIDVLIVCADGVGVLENLRHGRMKFRALEGLSALQGATSLAIGDFDGNGSWDLLGAGSKGASVVLTDRTPAGVANARNALSITSEAVRSAATGDIDNDSGLDLVLFKDDGVTIYRGDGRGGFKAVEREGNEWLKSATIVKVGDYDRDGDLDLYLVDQSTLVCHSSQCRESDNPKYQWIEIQLIGEPVREGEQNWDKRVNHINRGGLIELKAGSRFQMSVVNGTVNHFGLGTISNADVARVIWANGIPFNSVKPAADLSLCIEQKLQGSCPYLYSWNGERFEFVTDLLWNAPLGLKFAEDVVAPWREWEYLKIDGKQLKATQGEYQLRVTAELWEAEYFDQIKLFAVDHPAGTAIYTNEKVGPASIAEPKIHTVAAPRSPIAARDTKGRDILDVVLKRDGKYTKTFDQRLAQGFTEEHFLELDLGEIPTAKKITLFLTGWIYPGSTSLRVQTSQNPDLPKPRPPAILAPDANGEWREVNSYMGFPGGKTKTIAVDVSDIFTNHDHRLRIVSTMELFWDQAFFTVDDAPVDLQQTELTLVKAELHDRGGVSLRSWPPSGYGPDRFDYTTVVSGEQWPAMTGYFTRFGDVLPLLTKRDDHLVISGSGDEIQLSFAEPAEPLREGWVRDFVIYTVGWDKDADPNTVYGCAVEPMPFEAMTDYAHRDGLPRPMDAEYEQYLREYQTRQRNPTKFWRTIQNWPQK